MSTEEHKKDMFSPRQAEFLRFYLDKESKTYNNAYASAVEAGYSDSYARVITVLAKKWFRRATAPVVSVDEIVLGIMRETRDRKPTVRLKAWELLGKHQKMFTDKIEHGIDEGLQMVIESDDSPDDEGTD